MSIRSESFPARSVARKYLERMSQEGLEVLGMREERLFVMAYAWTNPSKPRDMRRDLARLQQLKSKELAFLVVDLERTRTIIDLLKESDYVIEMQAELHLSRDNLELCRSINAAMALIQHRLDSLRGKTHK